MRTRLRLMTYVIDVAAPAAINVTTGPAKSFKTSYRAIPAFSDISELILSARRSPPGVTPPSLDEPEPVPSRQSQYRIGSADRARTGRCSQNSGRAVPPCLP